MQQTVPCCDIFCRDANPHARHLMPAIMPSRLGSRCLSNASMEPHFAICKSLRPITSLEQRQVKTMTTTHTALHTLLYPRSTDSRLTDGYTFWFGRSCRTRVPLITTRDKTKDNLSYSNKIASILTGFCSDGSTQDTSYRNTSTYTDVRKHINCAHEHSENFPGGRAPQLPPIVFTVLFPTSPFNLIVSLACPGRGSSVVNTAASAQHTGSEERAGSASKISRPGQAWIPQHGIRSAGRQSPRQPG